MFLFMVTPFAIICERQATTWFQRGTICCYTYINVVGINKVRALVITEHIQNNACVIICIKEVFSPCQLSSDNIIIHHFSCRNTWVSQCTHRRQYSRNGFCSSLLSASKRCVPNFYSLQRWPNQGKNRHGKLPIFHLANQWFIHIKSIFPYIRVVIEKFSFWSILRTWQLLS